MTTTEFPDIDLSAVTLDEPEEKPTRTRKPRSDRGQTRVTRGTSTKKLADDLLVPWGMVAAGVSVSAPTVGAVMMVRGEATMDAVVRLASAHPRMLAALKKGTAYAPAAELATTGLYMALALLMDTGRLSTEAPIVQSTGLDQIYAQVHPSPEQMAAMQQPPNGAMFAFTGPPNPGM